MCSTVEWHVVSAGCLTALKSWFQILCGVCMFSHMSVCVFCLSTLASSHRSKMWS